MPELSREAAKDYLEHFPPIISKELTDFVLNEVFLESRYIFTHREGKVQKGYCTHCNQEFVTEGYKHNEQVMCPFCYSTCIAKASGRGRKNLLARAYFVYYEKSVIDPKVIVARGIEAYRDYDGDYKKVETEYYNAVWYVFDPKNGPVMFSKSQWYGKNGWYGGYQYYKKIGSYYYKYNQSNMLYVGYSRDSIKEAVKGTPFRWSGWEKYQHEDMTKFFALYSKYPCVEYLTKLGFYTLVDDRLNEYNTFRAINWRGKDLFKVLKINKQQLKEIKAKKIHLTYYLLYLLQRSRKLGWGLTLEEALEIEVLGYHYFQDFEKLLCYSSVKRISNYFRKQREKFGQHFISHTSIFTTYRDYINDCKKLEMDLKEDSVLFPKDLYRAHQNTIKQVSYIEDKDINEKITKRLTKLNKYCFNYNGLIIRPAESSGELIVEGKALHHCVGGYAKRYADGETIIMVIRREAEPEEPFYTMEMSNNSIRQCRGKNNCDTTKEVKAFIEEFKKQRLQKSKSKKKIKEKIPA